MVHLELPAYPLYSCCLGNNGRGQITNNDKECYACAYIQSNYTVCVCVCVCVRVCVCVCVENEFEVQ